MDILVVDDEHLARERLKRLIDDIPDTRVVGEAHNGHQALLGIEQYDPDLVLMDVRMPGIDGVSAAEQISLLEDPPALIFCTAYEEYALDAINAQASGYLLKPVKREQLCAALEKSKKTNKLQRYQLSEAPSSGREHITAKTRKGVELISLDSIRYFHADQKYVTAYHTDGETLLDEPLKDLETEFASRFIRVHRNALVSVRHIQSIERNDAGQYVLNLDGVEGQPMISRRHVSQIKELLSSL